MNAGLQWTLALVGLVLVATVMFGLYRIWRGPDLGDRMLATQLFGTTGVAVLLVLSELQQMPALRDVALVLALLAVMSTVAFVARFRRSHSAPESVLQAEDQAPARKGDPL
ncbi:monovalent cation/H+ antiporter complex subunit F [Hydrocarboniclastica marina]|uniref:pH regulation protein F n=1 Tax=Hydrocarboniclastica marina TaxID=2259620 RepID=A0A4P7XDG5_9ALTE|nr:monovalent cation/H+ antiporter complex subunit F [Hydrocarboniclastica marina]MAL98749.1 pH regulation protein F [Alteromonadaceae bacterium]QCF24635.1 pH regulation protein F [Hydrocarboniclastica marina]|tara:strand:+ start:3568 stop:3900 length:333 start_codon:yes stop_codon:yes gene_type:complete